MSYSPYNPSYYRSHHYAHQFNLPDSALVNRKMPVFTSEMPQGVNAFVPSNKKHFQKAGYHSIISQDHLINHQSPDEANSPAKNKDYERNLSIEDIEGASTNTLISKAIKNRIKAKEYYLRREKDREVETARRVRIVSNYENASKQEEAEKLIKKDRNEVNYHERTRAIRTEESRESPPYDQPSNEIINRYRSDLQDNQREIRQLQRKLQFAKRRADPEKIEQLKSTSQIDQKYVAESKASMKPSLNELKLPKINEYKSVKNPQPYAQMQTNDHKVDRKRSYTQPAQQLYEQQQANGHYYPREDKVVQKQAQKVQQLSSGERVLQSRVRRQQIRKMNPTYLSYGSFTGVNNSRMVYL